jgi:hypothetical protein
MTEAEQRARWYPKCRDFESNEWEGAGGGRNGEDDEKTTDVQTQVVVLWRATGAAGGS